MTNLFGNAYKFTDSGGRIELSLEKAGKQAIIRLRDDGIGVASDQLARIFDLFVQIDTSMERSVGGLGIGLALAKTWSKCMVENSKRTVPAWAKVVSLSCGCQRSRSLANHRGHSPRHRRCCQLRHAAFSSSTTTTIRQIRWRCC